MHGIDAHTLVDVVSLLASTGGAILAAIRTVGNRLSALEKQVAEINGALKAKGIL